MTAAKGGLAAAPESRADGPTIIVCRALNAQNQRTNLTSASIQDTQ